MVAGGFLMESLELFFAHRQNCIFFVFQKLKVVLMVLSGWVASVWGLRELGNWVNNLFWRWRKIHIQLFCTTVRWKLVLVWEIVLRLQIQVLRDAGWPINESELESRSLLYVELSESWLFESPLDASFWIHLRNLSLIFIWIHVFRRRV